MAAKGRPLRQVKAAIASGAEISPDELRRVLDQEQTEARFQAEIERMAKAAGWLHYHTHDSRRSQAGYPDLTLVRGRKLLFRELKTETGRVTPEQRRWLEALEAAGQDAGVWRPRDWPAIREVLQAPW